ncbi:MAG TPA: hypothetical protein PLQ52_07350, partial [Lacunisphaera sp.]|nr:hypothetical protein [Lacunisphaera sp.]
ARPTAGDDEAAHGVASGESSKLQHPSSRETPKPKPPNAAPVREVFRAFWLEIFLELGAGEAGAFALTR